MGIKHKSNPKKEYYDKILDLLDDVLILLTTRMSYLKNKIMFILSFKYLSNKKEIYNGN